MRFNFLTLSAGFATQLPAKPAGGVKEGETQSKASYAALITQDYSETELSHVRSQALIFLQVCLVPQRTGRLSVCVSVRLLVMDLLWIGYGVEKWITTKPALPLVKFRKGLSLSPKPMHSHLTLY